MWLNNISIPPGATTRITCAFTRYGIIFCSFKSFIFYSVPCINLHSTADCVFSVLEVIPYPTRECHVTPAVSTHVKCMKLILVSFHLRSQLRWDFLVTFHMILDVNLPGLPTFSSCLLHHMCVFVLSLNHISQPRATRSYYSLSNLSLDHGKLSPKNWLAIIWK